MIPLYVSYLDLKWHFDPAAASAAGFVSADSRLGSFDAEATRQHVAALRAMGSAVEELEVDGLAEEIDRTAFLDEIRNTIARFERERPHVRDPSFWLGHVERAIQVLLLRPSDVADERAAAVVQRMAAVPHFLDAARSTLRKPPAILADWALARLGSVGELLVRAASTVGAEAPGELEALNPAVAAALQALARFGTALRDEIEADPDLRAFALGEERFSRLVQHEHALQAGAADLWRYGQRIRDEVEAQLTVQAKRLDPQRGWREVVATLAEDTVRDPVAACRTEVERARELLRERQVVPLPDALPEIAEAPAFLGRLPSGAVYEPPPVLLEPGLEPAPGRLFVGPFSAASAPSLCAHEAIPGHHLRASFAQRLAAPVRRTLGAPITVEGWALYAEELMDDAGITATAETRIVRLARLHRAVLHLLIDVGLHARDLSPADAVSLLAENPLVGRQAGEESVRRCCASPAQGLAAAAGRREILRLRAAFGAEPGRAEALNAFHAAMLGYGGVPLGLAGWGMGLST